MGQSAHKCRHCKETMTFAFFSEQVWVAGVPRISARQPKQTCAVRQLRSLEQPRWSTGIFVLTVLWPVMIRIFTSISPLDWRHLLRLKIGCIYGKVLVCLCSSPEGSYFGDKASNTLCVSSSYCSVKNQGCFLQQLVSSVTVGSESESQNHRMVWVEETAGTPSTRSCSQKNPHRGYELFVKIAVGRGHVAFTRLMVSMGIFSTVLKIWTFCLFV